MRRNILTLLLLAICKICPKSPRLCRGSNLKSFHYLLLILTSAASAQTILRDAHLDQHLGQQLPINLLFTDDHARSMPLADCINHRPTILILGYYACPDLCPMTRRHLTQGLNGIALEAGREFNIIFISIDPRETVSDAAAAKLDCLRAYKGTRKTETESAWHFLIGPQDNIDQLKQAVGFHSVFDAAHNRFAHAAGIIVLTPDARPSHYFFGIDYSPADLESALHDAAVTQFTPVTHPEQQYCFFYDPAQGHYGQIIWRMLRITSGTWIALLLGYIVYQLSRDYSRPSPAQKEVHS